MPDRCQLCSSTSCCVTWSPPLPVEPDASSETSQRTLTSDVSHELSPWDARFLEPAYLPYWTLSGDFPREFTATRARARIARTREESD